MTTSRRPWLKPGLRLALVLAALGVGNQACDGRFDFDKDPAGAGSGGAPVATGGVLSSGAKGGLAGSGGMAVAATGNLGGGAGHAGSGESGYAGAAQACGTLSECSLGLHCAADLCAQCTSDADCAVYGLPRCEGARHRCVACTTKADCESGFACDSLANRCLKTCVEDSGCKGAHGCDGRRLVCYQCDEDGECSTSPLGHLCASDGSGCIQCRKESDCPNQHCDQLSGSCVDCRDGRDCASMLCDPTNFSCAPG